VSLAAQKAIETLPKGPDGKPTVTPEIQSDNGSCYISKEFRVVLQENALVIIESSRIALSLKRTA
jgi:transposase InsO family protein